MIKPLLIKPPPKFLWNKVDGNSFTNDLNDAYDQIIFWRKHIFLLPTGAAGKKSINEITRIMYLWINDTPMKDIAFKAIHVMPVSSQILTPHKYNSPVIIN